MKGAQQDVVSDDEIRNEPQKKAERAGNRHEEQDQHQRGGNCDAQERFLLLFREILQRNALPSDQNSMAQSLSTRRQAARTSGMTAAGEALRERAADVPAAMAGCVQLTQTEAAELYRLLYLFLDGK